MKYRVCFLVNKLDVEKVKREYVDKLNLPPSDVFAMELYKDPSRKKTKASDMRLFLQDVEEHLYEMECEYVVICNSDYYKLFTKESKAEANLGYIKNVENLKVLYAPDAGAIFYDPERTREKILRSLTALNDDLEGKYTDPGKMSYQGQFPKSPEAIKAALDDLLEYAKLTCDIETYSLKPHLAGLTSIAFAPNEKEGIAFLIDPSKRERNEKVRGLLKDFFKNYQGRLIFHNIAYDATVLIYQLWMEDITDVEGLLEGTKHLLKSFDDTKLIAYLATNSCAGNELGLKALAQEFAGNYAQENIDNVALIAEEALLDYNLVDCLSTWFVYNKYYPVMVEDQQEEIYKKIFIPATKDIIQMQLTGFPLNMKRVLEVEKILQKDMDISVETLNKNRYIIGFVDILKQEWVETRNSKLKIKRVTLEDAKVEFNPRSTLQLRKLFYSVMGLPVLNKTDTGMPSTDSGTIQSLLNHTDNKEIKEVLQALIDFSAVDKILTAFIPSFKEAVYSPWTQWHYLIGSFNLGGTVSGRLSSSAPNLQNLPATGSKYAKIVKSCFQAPKGWLLCGLDFAALEDHISALLTKDHNKLKVYLDHYDGHCLRSYSYFSDKMPDITEQLEEIKKEGKVYRVTLEDGSIKYFNEYNPEFITLKEKYALY